MIRIRKQGRVSFIKRGFALFVLFLGIGLNSRAQTTRWTEQAANDWYAKQPWLVGSNYIPSTAINELEMWQPATFDPKRIDLELGWAQSLGLNTMRVFLHDLLWKQDPEGFKKRINYCIRNAQKYIMKNLFMM